MGRLSLIGFGLIITLAACAPATTDQQRTANCAVGTAGGAVLGGMIGNQFGGGSGNNIMTAAGATAGGLAGANTACQ